MIAIEHRKDRRQIAYKRDRRNAASDKHSLFMGDDMKLTFNDAAGVIDFVGALFPELSTNAMTHRVSDHFPLWAEFLIDRSAQQMAETLGADPDAPDPLGIVPD